MKIRTIGSAVVMAVLMVINHASTPLAVAAQNCSLPEEIIPYTVLPPDNDSFTPVKFEQMPAGFAITNGTYLGWCVQYDVLVAAGPTYHARLYDSLAPSAPHLQNIAWNRVNYVLNHKKGTTGDIQFAVWYALGQAPSPPATTPATEMKNAIDLYGDTFVPTNGHIVGILVESEEGVQRIIMETSFDDVCRDRNFPTARITQPSADATYTQPQTVTLSAEADDDNELVKVEFYDGDELKATLTQGPFQYDWPFTEQDNGAHRWTIRAYDGANNVTVSDPVTLTVAIDTVAPFVSINSPSSGGTYVSAQNIPFIVNATDEFGVTKVELYSGSNLIGTIINPPFTFDWNIDPSLNGSHSITARAYDAAGNTSDSDPVLIEIMIDTVGPVVSISTPVSGSVFTRPGAISFAADATDNMGITRVEYLRNGISQGSVSLAPFTYHWNITGADNGTHTWTARAHDTSGNTTLSAPVTVVVDIDVTPPTINITSPASGTTYSNTQPVAIVAEANDDVGVTAVEIYHDGSLKARLTALPYLFDWPVTAADNGDHTWSARAYDDAGHMTESTPISLTVKIDTIAPTITLSGPVSGTEYTEADTLTFTASVADNFGVARVEFYRNGLLAGTRTGAPYTFEWPFTSADNGNHTWTARVYDHAGLNSTSDGINVIVNLDIFPPTIAIIEPTSGQTITESKPVRIVTEASDNMGITKVEYYHGDTLKGATTSEPHEYVWVVTEDENGSHPWSARAYDTAGNSTMSATVNLSIRIDETAPEITLTSPAHATQFEQSQTVTISVDATDNLGIDRVEFYNGDTLLGTQTLAPFSLDWNITEANNGSHNLSARAYDEAGHRTDSETVTVTVAIDVMAPTIAISAPADGIVYSKPSHIILVADATDNFGVSKVEFYHGTLLKGTKTSPPYTMEWNVNGTDNGSHSWMARAYDNAGNMTESSAKVLQIQIDEVAPAVAIVSPADGTTVTGPQRLSVRADATDDFGVARVEFYHNSILTDTLTTPPYELPWSIAPTENGNHVWRAHAYDAAGNSRLSDPVSVFVELDAERPIVAIDPPRPSSWLGNSTILVTGTASDNVEVSHVLLYMNDGKTRIVDGTTNWSTVVHVDHGESYTARVRAVDTTGNPSIIYSSHFTHVNAQATSPVLLLSMPQPGVVKLDFYAPWEREFDVYVSADLKHWMRLGPAQRTFVGQYQFVDPNANTKSRFYRLVRTK